MQFSAVKGIPLDQLPKNLEFTEVESRLAKFWEEKRVYNFIEKDPRPPFIVDTPPPTVSGSLHVGHIFSYTQTDILARFQRMDGKNVFYPMGWDDNGLPTERRVQNFFHIRCEPSLPYEPGLQLPPILSTMMEKELQEKKIPQRSMSRKNFVEHCHRLTVEDEKQFKNLFTRSGLSVDWGLEYATIGELSQKIAQQSFLDLVAKKYVYQVDAPTLWDCDFRTAVAQAELEDREIPGAFHEIEFNVEGGGLFTIATTRPELLPACVGVAAHPDDERYKQWIGRTAITPLFHAPVKIFASDIVQPDKGTGILMVCTFGDQTDVQWWREQKLPLRQIVGRDGRLESIEFSPVAGSPTFPSQNPGAANEAYALLKGKNVKQAQKQIVEMLKLATPPKPIQHAVKFYEKGDRPVEILTTRQWFVKLLDKKQKLIEYGDKIQWHPEFMKARYKNWTENLGLDWCVSRQRFFGVPIPVWYPLDAQGKIVFDRPIIAEQAQLPVDPTSDVPNGFTESQRGQSNGFVGESDVFDTWFTSSLTPQIARGWLLPPHPGLPVADLRPQSHEIIRTWAFYTIAKAMLHEEKIPWKHIAVSGWILDPDRKKMSKSKGNVVTPTAFIDEHGADAVRYWAGLARYGMDTAFDPAVMKIGRRLAMKIFNAGKFVLSRPAGAGAITENLDLAFISKLQALCSQARRAFEEFEPAQALMESEKFFWSCFTDTYLELVKSRAWAETGTAAEQASAVHTLRLGLQVMLRLFAPFLPNTCEEVWGWSFTDKSESVHRAVYPGVSEFDSLSPKGAEMFDVAVSALAAINQQKTLAKVSVARPVAKLELKAHKDTIHLLEKVWLDVKSATKTSDVKFIGVDGIQPGQFEVAHIEFGPDNKERA